MMSMSARVIADNVFRQLRLTTMELLYPTAIHADVMSALWADSPKQVTVYRRTGAQILAETQDNLFIPEDTGSATVFGAKRFVGDWKSARSSALSIAAAMLRPPEPACDDVIETLLAPYSHTRVLVTTQSWTHLTPPKAQSVASWEFRKLAECVSISLQKSPPADRELDDWHLPYIENDDIEKAVCHALQQMDQSSFISETALIARTTEACQQISAERISRFRYSACGMHEIYDFAYGHQCFTAVSDDGIPEWSNSAAGCAGGNSSPCIKLGAKEWLKSP